jgi:hypothetical protein
VSLKLYRPGPSGLEPASVVTEDYRTRLRSRRWRLPPLKNPEAKPVTALAGAVMIAALAVATFAILVAGYASGFWGV